MAGIAELLPARRAAMPTAPVSGTVFKIERGRPARRSPTSGCSRGRVRARDRVRLGPRRHGQGDRDRRLRRRRRPSGVRRSRPARSAALGSRRQSGSATRSATTARRARRRLVRAADARDRRHPAPARRPGRAAHRAHPARRAGPADQPPPGRLTAGDRRLALRRGAEGGHPGDAGRPTSVSRSTFRETTTICIERPAGSGAAVELISTAPNPFLATVGLRVDPAAVGSGVTSGWRSSSGSMPIRVHARRSRRPSRHAAAGRARLAGHGLRGDLDALRLLRRGRATRTPCSTRACRAPRATSATSRRSSSCARSCGPARPCTSRCTGSAWRSPPTRSARAARAGPAAVRSRTHRRSAGASCLLRGTSRRRRCTSCGNGCRG